MTFPSVSGHQAACAVLARALQGGRAHAFLLHGPRSVGKTTVAEDAAAALVECAPHDLARHADVFRLRPAIEEKTGEEKQIGVDDVERFITALAQSAAGAVKVGIVESAERLTVQSQNALLKTVEEPRGATVLFFVTDDPERLLPTLRSRMVPLAFGLVADADVAACIERRGGIHAAHELADIIRRAAGRPGVALRLLDADTKAADDTREVAVQSLLTGPKSARLRAAALMAKGDDAASREELVEVAVRAAQVLHSTFTEKCGTMSDEERRAYAQAAALLNDAPSALRDYANPALIFERVILALP